MQQQAKHTLQERTYDATIEKLLKNEHTTPQELLETMSSIWSVQSIYNDNHMRVLNITAGSRYQPKG
jgi:gamma-glutamylcysteine synthetase